MGKLRPILEKIANEMGALILTLYYDKKVPRSSIGKNLEKIYRETDEFLNAGISGRIIIYRNSEINLKLKNTKFIEPIIAKLAKEGLLYDLFLVDLSDDRWRPHGRSWVLYDFMHKVGGVAALVDFYLEIIKWKSVPISIYAEIVAELRKMGKYELGNAGQSIDRIKEWESIIV